MALRYVGPLSLSFLFCAFSALPSHAAYERPLLWMGTSQDFKKTDSLESLERQFASPGNLIDPVPIEQATSVLDDPESRISPEFRVPPELRVSTEFWFRIFTEFTSHHVVLFDEHHQELVYEVIDLRPIPRSSLRAEKIQKTLAAYERAFKRLARGTPRKPTREEAIILETLKRSPHRHSMREYAENLKTQRGARENMIRGLLAAEPYFLKMESIFSSMGVPRELTRLTLVESSFDFNALSKVGALGVWQFMTTTALEYLTLNPARKLDERLSPWKATVAAGRLLQWNYNYLGNWVLAVTAYNHGIRRLPRLRSSERAIYEAHGPGSKPDQEFKKVARLFESSCRSRTPLGWASRNYFAEFLAVLHAEAYRTRFYGNPPESLTRPVQFEPLRQSTTGQALAMTHGISLPEFQRLNPDIQSLKTVLPRGFLVALPSTRDDFKQLFNTIRGPTPELEIGARKPIKRSPRVEAKVIKRRSKKSPS